jgi:choline dehydrogenase-like flavoprotein
MDRACRDVFGAEHVMAVPTVRPTRPVGGRPACCGSNHCGLCPVDAKGTALNTVFPAIRERVELATGLLAEEVRCARGRVDHVVARDAEGRKHRLAGRQVVVACNGIDSCMLLLRSPEVPRHAALGRYYMDHATFSLAAYGTGLPTRPGLADSAQTGTITRFFEKTGDDLPVSLLGAAKSADVVGDAGGAERARIVPDLFRLAAEGRLSRAATLRERVKEVWDSLLVVRFLVETQPRAENRVEIARIAPSGQPIPRVVLDYPAYLEACIARVTEVMRKALPRADVRFVRRDPGAQHWLGATRMSEREEDGCVDRDLRWHGLAGLYVLSGSVFPGSSSANPTLTIAALALRLGDRLGAGTPSGL